MEFLNLHLPKTLRSPEFIGSDPPCRATWLCLMGYCAETENGGRVIGCRGWKDRKWQQICGVTLREVLAETDLWTWDGDDLLVTHYPIDAETNLRTKREIARTNGQTGGRRKKTDVGSYVGSDIGSNVATETEPTLASLKERERKGKEKEREVEVGGGIDDKAVELAGLHPKRSMTMPVLRAAAAAIERHGFETVAAGVRGYAAAVAEWTPAERSQFIKNPEVFFAEDLWNQPQANWPSRTGARTAANGNHRAIHVGGRKPSGIMTFDDEP
jgi:hypothetical protein